MEGNALVAGKGEELAGGSGHVRDGAELRENHEDGHHSRCALRGCIVEHLFLVRGFSYGIMDFDIPG